MPAIADRLEEVSDPQDRVFIFGSEPELLFYARRVHATRYIFLFPLYGPYPTAREAQRSVVAELEASRPSAVVYLPPADPTGYEVLGGIYVRRAAP